MRRGAALMTSTILFLLALPAFAQTIGSCQAAFTEADWTQVPAADVELYVSGVPDEQRDRFASQISMSAGWISDELGAVDGTVCLVGEASTFDQERFNTGSLLFHAALVTGDRIVAINTDQPGRVGAAAAFGLVHLRLWQESGGTGWPEPLASAVAHWYEARLLGRLELRHAEARAGNLFTGTSQIDWAESTQPPTLLWDPAGNESVLGDLIAHAVAAEGTGVLLDPDPELWAQREERWRIALRTELTGRAEPTTLWISGVVLTVALVVVAMVVAGLGIWSKRRAHGRFPTPPPVPGFFENDEQPTVESTGDRR